MSCIKKITADITFDCQDKALKGLAGSKAVIINFDDIDPTATTSTGATISELNLKSGSTGFSIGWYKDLGSTAIEFTPNSEVVDGFAHSFLCRLGTSSAANAEIASELKGGRFIIVVETNYKGVSNADAFKVYGFENGLELSEMTGNSGENAGSLLFTLRTKEDTYEEYPYAILSETDYLTTKASFDSLFASV